MKLTKVNWILLIVIIILLSGFAIIIIINNRNDNNTSNTANEDETITEEITLDDIKEEVMQLYGTYGNIEIVEEEDYYIITITDDSGEIIYNFKRSKGLDGVYEDLGVDNNSASNSG